MFKLLTQNYLNKVNLYNYVDHLNYIYNHLL